MYIQIFAYHTTQSRELDDSINMIFTKCHSIRQMLFSVISDRSDLLERI